MPERKVSFIEGEYYHVYNRGNSKQQIFHDKEDYQRLMSLLYLSNSDQNFKIQFLGKKDIYDGVNRGKQLVAIGAWTLMPNHFHLLATPTVEGGLSKFMQKLTTGYSMYYNQKYKRTGGLFEGKFKAQHIAEDRYMKYLFSYIHLNCLKLIDKKWKEKSNLGTKKYMNYLESFKYSSYQDYLDQVRGTYKILDLVFYPPYFLKKGSMQKELLSWISYRKDL